MDGLALVYVHINDDDVQLYVPWMGALRGFDRWALLIIRLSIESPEVFMTECLALMFAAQKMPSQVRQSR